MKGWDGLVAGGLVRAGVELSRLTTYKLGGRARWFCEPRALEDLRSVSLAARARGIEMVVMGRGSNLVISDEGYPGLVIRLGAGFRKVGVDREARIVRAGAAVSLPVLARRMADESWSGLEFYVGIPGSVGGAVRMNAGFFGVETVDVIRSASILDTGSGSVIERDADELGLGYRTSNLGPGEVVLDASYSVREGDRERIGALMRKAIRWRRDHQPGGTLNAGSVFRNPPGDSAGRIIDALGLKGMRRGGAHVSPKHANFFVVDPGGTAQDVFELVQDVWQLVLDRTGILLEPEVRFVGFPRDGVRQPLRGNQD
ncbi:MAG: UDP-N-acetylmuramate dehydrogenase [Acidimicrobiia bacterium]|nr:UDP-N-acetylmuramate dehydrogenase [Acidimicrobiia bacterium]